MDSTAIDRNSANSDSFIDLKWNQILPSKTTTNVSIYVRNIYCLSDSVGFILSEKLSEKLDPFYNWIKNLKRLTINASNFSNCFTQILNSSQLQIDLSHRMTATRENRFTLDIVSTLLLVWEINTHPFSIFQSQLFY